MKTAVGSCFRLTIPIDLVRSSGVATGNYVKIVLRKGCLQDCLYLRIPSKPPSRRLLQVRRKLPDRIIRSLQLKPNDSVEISSISRIESPKPDRSFVDGEFDLLSVLPENVMAESFTMDSEEWCRFWSSSKNGGLANTIELKRFVPINRETGEFFGLMQAESCKKGCNFTFTNTLISEHKRFIEIAGKLGISASAWKWGFIIGPRLSESETEACLRKFIDETSLNPPNYKTKSKTLISAAYQIYVSSHILNKLMNNALKFFRKQIPETLSKERDRDYEDFRKGFIAKYLLGDGTITFPSQSSTQIVLTEGDAESRKDFRSMLKLFNINSSEQAIRVCVSTDFDSLIWFLENGLFVGHEKNRKKLLAYVLRNYYVKTAYERLSKIGYISIEDYANALGLPYNTASMSLHRYQKRKFLRSERSGGRTVFCLTEKREKFIGLMKRIEYEDCSTLDISDGNEFYDSVRNTRHLGSHDD